MVSFTRRYDFEIEIFKTFHFPCSTIKKEPNVWQYWRLNFVNVIAKDITLSKSAAV